MILGLIVLGVLGTLLLPIKTIKEIKSIYKFSGALLIIISSYGLQLLNMDESPLPEKPEEINLVITDIARPEMDGRATFKAIREIDPKVPIIVCSGFLPDLGLFALEVGSEPDGFVQKPYEIGTMLKTVVNALGRSQGDKDPE